MLFPFFCRRPGSQETCGKKSINAPENYNPAHRGVVDRRGNGKSAAGAAAVQNLAEVRRRLMIARASWTCVLSTSSVRLFPRIPKGFRNAGSQLAGHVQVLRKPCPADSLVCAFTLRRGVRRLIAWPENRAPNIPSHRSRHELRRPPPPSGNSSPRHARKRAGGPTPAA